MLTWVLDDEGSLVFPVQLNQYGWCPECFEPVHSAFDGTWYFFHPSGSRCHLAQRTHKYFLVQKQLQQELGCCCAADVYFPNIPCVASLVIERYRVVIEIQMVSQDDFHDRSRKYDLAAWTPLWLLHADTFGSCYASAGESSLAKWPHYFTDYDGQCGAIWDDMSYVIAQDRYWWGTSLRRYISLRDIQLRHIDYESGPLWYVYRASTWKCRVRGDYFERPSPMKSLWARVMHIMSVQMRLIWACCIK